MLEQNLRFCSCLTCIANEPRGTRRHIPAPAPLHQPPCTLLVGQALAAGDSPVSSVLTRSASRYLRINMRFHSAGRC